MTFLIISVIVFNLLAILMPKRMTRYEMYTTILFSTGFQMTVDIFLDLKYDLYGYFNKGVDWLAIIPVFGIYPPVSILILNFYPFSKGIRSKAIYILGWSVFLVGYEWASVLSGYFYHHGWKYWYSALAYPVILIVLAWNLIYIRRQR